MSTPDVTVNFALRVRPSGRTHAARPRLWPRKLLRGSITAFLVVIAWLLSTLAGWLYFGSGEKMGDPAFAYSELLLLSAHHSSLALLVGLLFVSAGLIGLMFIISIVYACIRHVID